jgi:site-specific recombinase XerC
MTTSRPASPGEDTDLRYLRRSFVRHLAADRKSPGTRAAYSAAIAQLEAFLTAQGLPTTVRQLEPDHVEAFFVALHERQLRPATILARHHALSRFFGWLVAEGELTDSPLALLPRPYSTPRSAGRAERRPSRGAAGYMRRVCVRGPPRCRCDPLFADTGLRLTETTALQLDDVDLEANAVYLAGPSRTPRAVPFERPTTRALQRYLAARADHDRAYLSALWLGRRGPLTERGVDQAMRHRGQMAGMPTLRPHHFRHTFAQHYLAGGGNGRDLMRLVGWRSRQMLSRYRVGARAERPRAEWLRLGDRL